MHRKHDLREHLIKQLTYIQMLDVNIKRNDSFDFFDLFVA